MNPVYVFRGLALLVLISVFFLSDKNLRWIDLPESQVIICVALILALVTESLSGIVLVGAALIAFAKLHHGMFGSNWFHMVLDGGSNSPDKKRPNTTLMPPFVTAANLKDAQSNVFDEKQFDVGYKPSSYKVDYDAQGLDTSVQKKPITFSQGAFF